MAVTHTAADAIAATTMTNAVADIEQEMCIRDRFSDFLLISVLK